MFRRILILALFLFLTGITGIQKLFGNFPPEWFIQKFQGSLLNLFPGSLWFCYLCIVGLELLASLFFLLALIKCEFRENAGQRFSDLAFDTTLLLFTILFFGSFLAKDYENGFMDMGYFVFTIILRRTLLSEKQS